MIYGKTKNNRRFEEDSIGVLHFTLVKLWLFFRKSGLLYFCLYFWDRRVFCLPVFLGVLVSVSLTVRQCELSPSQTPHLSSCLYEPNSLSQPTCWQTQTHTQTQYISFILISVFISVFKSNTNSVKLFFISLVFIYFWFNNIDSRSTE